MCCLSIHQPRAPQKSYYREETWSPIVLGSNYRDGASLFCLPVRAMKGWSQLPGTWASQRGSPTSPPSLAACAPSQLGCGAAVWFSLLREELCGKAGRSFHVRGLSSFAWELHLSYVPCHSQPWLADWHPSLTLALPHHLWTVTDPGCHHQTCSACPAWSTAGRHPSGWGPFPAYLAHFAKDHWRDQRKFRDH